jgi:hypothetical protein
MKRHFVLTGSFLCTLACSTVTHAVDRYYANNTRLCRIYRDGQSSVPENAYAFNGVTGDIEVGTSGAWWLRFLRTDGQWAGTRQVTCDVIAQGVLTVHVEGTTMEADIWLVSAPQVWNGLRVNLYAGSVPSGRAIYAPYAWLNNSHIEGDVAGPIVTLHPSARFSEISAI